MELAPPPHPGYIAPPLRLVGATHPVRDARGVVPTAKDVLVVGAGPSAQFHQALVKGFPGIVYGVNPRRWMRRLDLAFAGDREYWDSTTQHGRLDRLLPPRKMRATWYGTSDRACPRDSLPMPVGELHWHATTRPRPYPNSWASVDWHDGTHWHNLNSSGIMAIMHALWFSRGSVVLLGFDGVGTGLYSHQLKRYESLINNVVDRERLFVHPSMKGPLARRLPRWEM